MKIKTYKTLIITTPPESFYTVVDSSMLMAKNIANPTLFLIKNIITSFQYNKETKSYHLKEEIHINQKQTIDLFNQVIPIINHDRLIKFNEKIKQQKQEKLLKSKILNQLNNENKKDSNHDNVETDVKEFIPLSLIVNTVSIQELQKLLTDKTVIENVLRSKASPLGREKEKTVDNVDKSNELIPEEPISYGQDYTNIHSVIAQYAVHQTVDNIKNHFKAVASYWKNYKLGDKPTPPQLPKYLDKNQRFTFELHYSRFNSKGNIFTINPKKHKLYSNFYNIEGSLIDLTTIEQFNSYNFKDSLVKEITKKLNSKSVIAQETIKKNNVVLNNNEYIDSKGNINQYELQTVSFVSHRKTGKGKNKKPLKIEAVVKIETEISDNSPLVKIINYYEQHKTVFKKEKLSYTELTTETQQKVILHFLTHHEKQLINNNNVLQSKTSTLEEEASEETSLPNNVTNIENSIDITNETIVKSDKTIINTIFTRYAGIDLGENNIAALALTHGKNIVYSGRYINHHLTHLNTKLDEIKSSIFKQSLSKELLEKVLYNQKISELNNFNHQYGSSSQINTEKLNEYLLKRNDFIQQHNLKKEDDKDYVVTDKLDKLKLNTEELKEINLANKAVYQNLNYVKTLVKMENFKKQTLHQLSSDILTHCLKNNIEILVIGKNEGWKDEINMGQENNRLFTALSHAKLIEQLEYKAILAGIVVITTEESYTSQSSFVHSDVLPTYEKQSKEKQINIKKEVENNLESKKLRYKVSPSGKNSSNDLEHKLLELDNNQSQHNLNHEIKLLQSDTSSLGKNKKQYNFSGIRKTHSYIFKKSIKQHNILQSQLGIHADINGGFNIIRKAIKGFSYNNTIDLSYELKGLKNQKKTKFSCINIKAKKIFFA